MKKPYIADGLDQQGRYTEAAEACTDLGAEPGDEYDGFNVFRGLLVAVFLTLAALGFVCLAVQ